MKADLQVRIFGFIDPQAPLPGSLKSRIYELAAARQLTEAGIEALAASVRRMHARIEQAVINQTE